MSNTNDQLEAVVKTAMENNLKTDKRPYSSIQEYKDATGKRFRMTRDQMKRRLTREDAFNEFLSTLSED